MAAENSNKLKLKTYTGTRKSAFTLVTLQSFCINQSNYKVLYVTWEKVSWKMKN